MPWALLGNKWLWIGLAFAALAAFGQYERWQAGRYEAIANADEERIKALGQEIATQNAAVDKLKAESAAAIKKSADSLKAVQNRVGSLQSEAKRLQAIGDSSKPSVRPAGCTPSDADKAVEAVRAGLK